jgi:hypothetical protein
VKPGNTASVGRRKVQAVVNGEVYSGHVLNVSCGRVPVQGFGAQGGGPGTQPEEPAQEPPPGGRTSQAGQCGWRQNRPATARGDTPGGNLIADHRQQHGQHEGVGGHGVRRKAPPCRAARTGTVPGNLFRCPTRQRQPLS